MSSSGVSLEKYFIPLDEINRATDNFSSERHIGGGGFGAVYSGQLSEVWKNQRVAVKRLDANSHQGDREFHNEIKLISRFHHKHIISFIGYCDEGVERIIVYEYALNGSLDYHLQHPNKMSCITWEQRLKICIGVARGLHYLHSGLGEHDRVIHRDVKSANILLDGNMVAKVCDFGLSKMGTTNQPDSQFYTKVAGTQSYLDPSYLESGILQKESDVYSSGVVLFEILSGTLVYREIYVGDERQSLMNTVRRYHLTDPYKLIDPCIRDQIRIHSFDRFKEIAYQCISLNLTERPTLDTVIEKLEEALNIQISEHSSFIPADRSRIESLTHKLISVTPYDQRIASCEIRLLTENCNENCVAFAEAGAIPRLTHLLTALDSQTQEHAVTALLNLSLNEDIRVIIISTGAFLEVIQVLYKCSNEAQEDAAATILNISLVDEEKDPMGSTGVIPLLVLMLSEGTTTLKMKAAKSLDNLCINSYGNIGRAVIAGLVPILTELFKEPEGVLKEESLSILAKLSVHPEGKLAIGEAEVVPHLVEVIGSELCQEHAVTVLLNLCDMDPKFMEEAHEHGAMRKLEYLLHHGSTYWGKICIRELGKITKDHLHVDVPDSYSKMNKDFFRTPADGSVIESLIGKLASFSPLDQRIASREIYLLIDQNGVRSDQFANAGAIPALIRLLKATSDSCTEKYTLSALDIIWYERMEIMIPSGCLPEILHILEKGSNVAREYAASTISKIYTNEVGITMGYAGAIPPLVLMMSEGTAIGKKHAANALKYLCIYDGNIARIKSAGALPILMDLLTDEGGLMEASVEILEMLSFSPEGLLAIGEAEGVPHLVELIGTIYRYRYSFWINKAVTILEKLCSLDQKYMVEAQEGLGKLKILLDSDSKYEQFRELRRMIKDHEHVNQSSNNTNKMTFSDIEKVQLKTKKMSLKDRVLHFILCQ